MDFEHIAVPFRMQPGLRRVAPGSCQLTPLKEGSPLWQEKRAVLEAGASRHCVPGFDPSAAIEAIARHARAHGLPAPHAGLPLELAFEEDFAVIEAGQGRLAWLCVCTPSHWAPEDKVGLPFAAVHAPVADAATLIAASGPIVRLITSGEAWERDVWTVSPSGRHDQHPRRHARVPWPDTPDAAEFVRQCWWRTERQTFLPVDTPSRQAVFTIHVQLQPLVQAVDSPAKARRLHDALASMSQAVLDYKNLAPARERLLNWLASQDSMQT